MLSFITWNRMKRYLVLTKEQNKVRNRRLTVLFIVVRAIETIRKSFVKNGGTDNSRNNRKHKLLEYWGEC